MYKVIIIEDDPMVAEINRLYISRNNLLRIERIFSDSETAATYLTDHQVDLIMLDYYLPGQSGRTFLEQFRADGRTEDVIMATAVNDTREITALYACGIVDYLIKPYQYDRFQQALNRFLEKNQALSGEKVQNQAAIDKAFGFPARGQEVGAEKGIQPATLTRLQDYLMERQDEKQSIEVIAAGVGLSRVTVRRYLNYMLSTGSVVDSVDYATGGRPSTNYMYIGA